MTNFQSRVVSVGVDAILANPSPGKFNHASLICYKGKILSIGLNNQYKTHTKSGLLRPEWPYIHAELSAIMRFKRETNIDLGKTELYNIRILKNKTLALSYPCKNCTKLIIAASFKKVYYSNNLGLFEQFIFRQ